MITGSIASLKDEVPQPVLSVWSPVEVDLTNLTRGARSKGEPLDQDRVQRLSSDLFDLVEAGRCEVLSLLGGVW